MTAKTERGDAIRSIQVQMADYGLALEDLGAAECFGPPPPVVCYRNAEGLILGRAGRDAVLAKAGGQYGAERGILPGWIGPQMNSTLCPAAM